jgi:hypothetical protein
VEIGTGGKRRREGGEKERQRERDRPHTRCGIIISNVHAHAYACTQQAALTLSRVAHFKKKMLFDVDQHDAKTTHTHKKNMMNIPARSLQRVVAEASNLRDELAKTVMDAVGRLAKMDNTSVFDKPRCLNCAGKEWGCRWADHMRLCGTHTTRHSHAGTNAPLGDGRRILYRPHLPIQ